MALTTVPKNVRASDRLDLGNQEEEGFVVRKRFLSIRKMAQLCLSGVIIVLGVVILLRNDTLVGSLLCVVVGSMLLYLGRVIEKQQMIINATEFMNAVYSSALCKGYTFSFIVRSKGAIIYLDRGFQELFPDFIVQPDRELSTLCDIYQFKPEIAARLTDHVRSGTEGALDFDLAAGSNRAQQVIRVTCEPIARPKGYVLVRGK